INATWISPAGGEWGNAANWANGRLPEAGEDIAITGLEAEAVITLTGDTPVLDSLSLDGGTLHITGALYTADLTLTGSAALYLSNSADSAVTGNASLGSETSFELQSGAGLTWSGATWDQDGFAHVTAGTSFTQESGRLRL